MLSALRDFFESHLGTAAAPEQRDEQHALRLATAALLVEVVRIDGAMQPSERDAVLDAVRVKFDLPPGEADELITLAEAEMKQANDYFQFTSLINRHFSPEQKDRIIELMWRVAYADSALTAHENHLMRKMADLLHVPHGNYIAAKMRAQQSGPTNPI